VDKSHSVWRRAARSVRQAFGEFLGVPIAIVASFLVLAAGGGFSKGSMLSSPLTYINAGHRACG
jgi:hypothetical protein